MSISRRNNNNVNEAGGSTVGPSSGGCPGDKQYESGCHPTTARMKWSREISNIVMQCYFNSKPVTENGITIRRLERRKLQVLQEIRTFEPTEQRKKESETWPEQSKKKKKKKKKKRNG